MFIAILLFAFAAVAIGFFLIYVPLQQSIKQTQERNRGDIARQLDEMFIFIPLEHLPVVKVGTVLLVGITAYILTYNFKEPAPYLFGAVGAVVGYYTPELIIHWLRKKRRRQFAEQLVDGLVLLSNGLRAGFTLQQAIEMLVEESRPPLSQEFELVLSEFKVGVDLDRALQNCVARTKDPDLELAITAISITRQMGGNLAEIFDRIVAMIRARKLLDGKVEAMTAQGKLQALIVGLLPYLFGFFVVKINPELMRLLWTTLPGFLALCTMIVLDVIGYLWVRKISDVKY